MSNDLVAYAPWMSDPQAPGRTESEARFTKPTDLCPRPERWLSTDCGSAELQVSEFLAGLVTALQPDLVVETGTAWGQTAKEIGRALRTAGRGECWSIELDPLRVECARNACFDLPVTIIQGNSLEVEIPEGRWIDFLFLDSSYENRIPEFERFRQRMRVGAIACFHDTAPGHGSEDLGGSDLRSAIEELTNVNLVHLPTPRGLTIVEVRGAPLVSSYFRMPTRDRAAVTPPPEPAGPEVPGFTSVVMPTGRRLRVHEHRVGANLKPFACWEQRYIETLMRVVRPGLQVYDVGAEEGEFAALVAGVVGGRNLHLFEPSPRVWPNIRAIWRANELEDPWTFPGFAAPTTRPESHPPTRPGWPAQAEGPIQTEGAFSVWFERPDLPAISLDFYARQTGHVPDVVMIDVEGAETVVLEGMYDLLRIARPVVFVSIHPPSFISRFGPGMEEAHAPQQEHVFRLLSQAGYIGRWIAQDHEAHWMFVPAGQAELLDRISQ